MFCCHCGKSLPDEAAFCIYCGKALVSATPTDTPSEHPTSPLPTQAQQPVYAPQQPIYAPQTVAYAPYTPPIPQKKKSKGWLIAIVSGVAVVAIIMALLFANGVFDTSTAATILSPKLVAKEYVSAELEGDFVTLHKLMVGNMQQCFEVEIANEGKGDFFTLAQVGCELRGIDMEIDTFEDYYEAQKRLAEYELQKDYGEDYEITDIEVVSVTDMDGDDLDARIETYLHTYYLKDYVDESAFDREQGKIVTVSYTITGSKQSREIETRIPVVKYDGRWRVAEYWLD